MRNRETHESERVFHDDMLSIPGNMEDIWRTCSVTACHPAVGAQVVGSLMNRGSGIISAGRRLFNDPRSSETHATWSSLGNSRADKYLKQMCGMCHLGNPKKSFGPIDEASRGGGCLACHLSPSSFAKGKHPQLSIRVDNSHCFGCHSRSSRISTNYEGWHETRKAASEVDPKDPTYRVLKGGRVFKKERSDVHFEKGLACIDCHQVSEVMGDGKQHARQFEQVRTRCRDCHLKEGELPTLRNASDLNSQEKRIIQLRGESHEDRRYLLGGNGQTYINVYQTNGKLTLVGKTSGKIYPFKATSEKCQRYDANHQDLSCTSCHSSWAPHCITCHTQEDLEGNWYEFAGDFLADEPTLGVIETGEERRIVPSIPAMIMTLGTGRKELDGFDAKTALEDATFHRQYAPIEPHTVSGQGRSCVSCHQSSLAVGYGRGKLSEVNGEWFFLGEYELLSDGLPADAWTGVGEPTVHEVNRKGFRSLTPQERNRVLRVGQCLQCHDDHSSIYKSFAKSLRHQKKPCLAESIE